MKTIKCDCFFFTETPNDGGGDGTDNRPINGEPELTCIVQDQEMEEGKNLRTDTIYTVEICKSLLR